MMLNFFNTCSGGSYPLFGRNKRADGRNKCMSGVGILSYLAEPLVL
jgi:hypothetical protein